MLEQAPLVHAHPMKDHLQEVLHPTEMYPEDHPVHLQPEVAEHMKEAEVLHQTEVPAPAAVEVLQIVAVLHTKTAGHPRAVPPLTVPDHIVAVVLQADRAGPVVVAVLRQEEAVVAHQVEAGDNS